MLKYETQKSLHIKALPPMKPRTLQKVCGGGGGRVGGGAWLRVILVLSFKPSLTI